MPNFAPHRTLACGALVAAAACADAPTASVPHAVELAGPAGTSFLRDVLGFDDGFTIFDRTRWAPQAHPLGRGAFTAANVVHDGAALRLVHPAGTVDGGEVASVNTFRYGSYEARLRTPALPGSISAFFLYQGGRRSDEIDIELLNDGSRRIWFTVWQAGTQKYHVEQVLEFDPAADFHDYRIEWAAGRVRFFVDGTLRQEFAHKRSIPSHDMYLMANTWWPTWTMFAHHQPQLVDQALVIDRVVARP